MGSFTLRPIPAKGELPEGWLLRLPLGDQHVTTDMYRIEPGVRGAFRMVVSRLPAPGSWEDNALAALIDIVSFMVTDWVPITEELVEGIALEFRRVWTTGTVVETLEAMRGGFPRKADEAGMHWVGVRRA